MTLPLDEIKIFSQEPKGGVQTVLNFPYLVKNALHRRGPQFLIENFYEILRKSNVEECQSENFYRIWRKVHSIALFIFVL